MRKWIVGLTLVAPIAMAQDESAGPATDATPPATATEAPTAAEQPTVKTLSGMSVLGNEEAPKSLVIVPWKSSRLGEGLGVENVLDERPRPVDKEVFAREVHYWELRSASDK